MGNIGVWQMVIIALIVLLLFGARRLPEVARGVGRSLKIFKAETKGLMEDDSKKEDDSVVADSAESDSASGEPRAVEPTKVETTGERANESTSRDA